MNRQEYLLTCLAEECAEVIQCVTKIQRFGLESIEPGQFSTNAERLIDEFNDVMAIRDLLMHEGVIDCLLEPRDIDKKKIRVLRRLKEHLSQTAKELSL